jgi:hypothetical protein
MKQAKKAKGLPIAATTQFSHLTFALAKARKLFLFLSHLFFTRAISPASGLISLLEVKNERI